MAEQLHLIDAQPDTGSTLERVLSPSRVPVGGTPTDRPCKWCGSWFRPKRPHHECCGDACRLAAWKANQGDPEAERDRWKALAAERCKIDTAIARWAALMCLRRHEAIIVSHVRAYLDGIDVDLAWELNWPGSLFEAPQEYQCAFCAFTADKSRAVKRHAKRIHDLSELEEGEKPYRPIHWFEFTGKRPATFHAAANARRVNEYRLTREGRIASKAVPPSRRA
jgi:hypothetical protein